MAEKKAATSASSIDDQRNIDLLEDMAGKKTAVNASSIDGQRSFDPLKEMAERKAATGGGVTIGDTMKSSVMQKDSKSGRVNIGYRA